MKPRRNWYLPTMQRSPSNILLRLVAAGLAAGVLASAALADQPTPRAALTPPNTAPNANAHAGTNGPVVVMKTSMGEIKVRLFPDKAPTSVENFLQYVDDRFYDGTIFHRVSEGYVVQGGGFTTNFAKKETRAPIKNEAGNGLSNHRGTVAMARINLVDSATSQFFVNVADNTFLDHKNETTRGFGYAVFGEVIEGMDVVDRIAAVKTGTKGPFPAECPLENVTILSIARAN
jgi:cyclophilin family peptidyl-prolyl cis-trans isomerase